MFRMFMLLCLTASLVCSPVTVPAAEIAFISVTVESVGRDGRAYKTVTADGIMSGGHMSGIPPRIYRNEGQMPKQELIQFDALVQRLAGTTILPDKLEGSPSSLSYRKLSITPKDRSEFSFTAVGDSSFATELLEQIYAQVAAQKVGGW